MNRTESDHGIRYEKHRAIIRLHGGLETGLVLRLCDEVDHAITYYHYSRIDLEIDSPGGQSRALQHLMSRLGEWQRYDVTIGTYALTMAASAGAVILALGSVGHRRASRGAQLLYHNARSVADPTHGLTQTHLEAIQRGLSEADRLVLGRLADHVWAGRQSASAALKVRPPRDETDDACEEVEVHSRDELESIYTDLHRQERILTPDEAAGLHLIDAIEHRAMPTYAKRTRS